MIPVVQTQGQVLASKILKHDSSKSWGYLVSLPFSQLSFLTILQLKKKKMLSRMEPTRTLVRPFHSDGTLIRSSYSFFCGELGTLKAQPA